MAHNKSLELNFSEQQKISFENNTIEFDFFIPNYIYNPHHVIEWRLEKDSTWNILNNKNTLTFSGLKQAFTIYELGLMIYKGINQKSYATHLKYYKHGICQNQLF